MAATSTSAIPGKQIRLARTKPIMLNIIDMVNRMYELPRCIELGNCKERPPISLMWNPIGKLMLAMHSSTAVNHKFF